MTVHFETFPVGPLQCNCSIIADEDRKEAIIVDPGDDAPAIIARVQNKGLQVRYLIHTHAHIDHVGATADVHQALGGVVCLHRDDLFLYDNLAMQSQFLGLPTPKQVNVAHYLEDRDSIEAASICVETLHTPGHTPGSLCFRWATSQGEVIFSGDTLFQGSIGRTDLWGGDYTQIIASIREKLLPLDNETIVIPGHGPASKIGVERRYNPFLRGLS